MVIKLMHDNFDSTVLAMLKKRINDFVCDMVVFPDKGGCKMMDRLILKFNSRPKHGTDEYLSDLKIKRDLLKSLVLPNTCESKRFTFELAYPDRPRDPMCVEFVVKLAE